MAGQIAATSNTIGVTGLVPGATLRVTNAYNTQRGYDLANSITTAANGLRPGDVMLLEQQTAGPLGSCLSDQVGCVAVEWVPAYYDAIEICIRDRPPDHPGPVRGHRRGPGRDGLAQREHLGRGRRDVLGGTLLAGVTSRLTCAPRRPVPASIGTVRHMRRLRPRWQRDAVLPSTPA